MSRDHLGQANHTAIHAIHRHYRAIRREQHLAWHSTPRGVLPRLRSVLGWSFRPTFNAIRWYFSESTKHHRGRDILRGILFSARFRVHPSGYDQYYLQKNWNRRAEYVYDDEFMCILGFLNWALAPEDSKDMYDKRKFYKRGLAHGLAVIPIIAEFEDGGVLSQPDNDDYFSKDLFSKPCNLSMGRGASLWRFSNGSYRSGEFCFDLRGLKEHLAKLSLSYPIALQPRIYNHRDVQPISGEALSTIRIVTIKRPSGTFEVAGGVFRMGVEGSVADNFNLGGVAAPIDLQSGVLGFGVRKGDPTRRWVKHPDTNTSIQGFVLPHWDAAKTLALKAHAAFSTMPSVGWDIAITPSGLILVEGNAMWGADVIQLAYDKPLAETAISECLAHHLAVARAVMPGGPVVSRSVV